ncbi:MAG: sigma-E processing peptidase SpoIIGA, partial [Lachnospiraceae bacterium]
MIQDTSLHYTIYVDRLFVDYMTVYCLLMLLVGQLMRRKLHTMRLLLCAAIWSITGILCLLFPAWMRRGGSIAIESLMGGLLFGLLYGKPPKRILAGVLMAHLLSVMYLTGCFEIAYRLEKWTGIRGSRLLLAGFLAAFFVVWMLRRTGKNLYKVRISYGGKECEVT